MPGTHTPCPRCGKSRGSTKHKTECLGHTVTEVRKKQRVIRQRASKKNKAIRVANWRNRILVDGSYFTPPTPQTLTEAQ